MPPPRQGDRKRQPANPKPRPHSQKQPNRKQEQSKDKHAESTDLDFSPIHISLQQLLLDVFKTALLDEPSPTPRRDDDSEHRPESLDTKSLIQTIKSHLYQRDFDSAFADAGEDLLRAYALRWSAARALGYAGLFKGVLAWMKQSDSAKDSAQADPRINRPTRAVCIGGGAGAEIVALAAAWRDLHVNTGDAGWEQRVAVLSLAEQQEDQDGGASLAGESVEGAVDIADWSSVVERLSRTISAGDVPVVPSLKYKPPLVPSSTALEVTFRRADVLSLPQEELEGVVLGQPRSDPLPSILVTLMFTLNELFSTSMAKSTDIMPPGSVLLVVDSPGSYSTLKLGKGKDGAAQERQYPMKFLLDHTLMSVAEGKWECVFSQDSRWWRRDAARLRYEVGEGAGLEDMRFQVHLYRRL
ncbi:Protein of unknown function DUF3115 [Penicillium chermesinum]|uniref:25S rRNA (Uridine(2843)-N(3))-methyltransferase n=1 Tax=Penicillium chermesinum TaxID=63820 RepID=A0A9W9PKE6_9EURO|nr:Protein of unknown function DUF3115 [Penicillium chermesinum]KAJ5247586.1 Protein of unknown function DUF3115 [Penicillium chermesinum]